MAGAEQPLVISVAEAAALIGRNSREIYSWLARGEIPRDVFFRSGRAIWFKRPALETWLGVRNGAGRPRPGSSAIERRPADDVAPS